MTKNQGSQQEMKLPITAQSSSIYQVLGSPTRNGWMLYEQMAVKKEVMMADPVSSLQ